MSEPIGAPEAHDERGHVPDAHGAPHAVEGAHGSTSDHGGDHGSDDHGHEGTALGPIDWRMWGVGILGVVVALVITAGFALATGFQFNA